MILKLFTMANLQIGRHSAFCPKAKGRSSTCCIPQGRRHCSGHPIFTQTLCKERKMYADSKPFDIWYIYIYMYSLYTQYRLHYLSGLRAFNLFLDLEMGYHATRNHRLRLRRSFQSFGVSGLAFAESVRSHSPWDIHSS